ncbi:MAG: tetratricopeptide repeat protein [Archaeoglobaceae archaeon]|nr:tetratricopeptide repeat protein [Archaeoglobaceae archaeon]
MIESTPYYARSAGIEWETLHQEAIELYRAGEYDRAIMVAKKALKIAEWNAGSNHPAVAASLYNLAELYKAKGKYSMAETLYKHAMEIWAMSLGPDHPDVAESLNNLADLYVAQGKYDRAEQFYRQAVEIFEKYLGPDNPRAIFILHKLVELYEALGEYDRAEQLYSQVWGSFKEYLPPIPELYHDTGQAKEAEELEKQVEKSKAQGAQMHCPECGKKLIDNTKLCSNCGHTINGNNMLEDRTSVISSQEKPVRSDVNTSSLGTKWLKFWNYFSLPVGGILQLLMLFAVPSLWVFLIPVSILQFVVAYGLHHRRLWAWKWNWVIIIIEYITGTIPILTPNIESYAKLVARLFFKAIFLGLIWMWPNYVYWKKRKVLFS